jgi:hypothetical protein
VDIRPPSTASDSQEFGASGESDTWGHEWVFDVAKNFSRETAGDEVVLEVSGIDGIPAGAAVFLADRELGRQVDLRTEGRYAFFQGKRDRVIREENARFALLVGSEEYVKSNDEDMPGLPLKTGLYQNHPNPFNPSTIIRYELAQPGRVTVSIYEVTGALVKALEARDRPAGRYEVGWDGENDRGERVASGVYFYRMNTPGFSQTRKMVILK